MPKAGAIVGYKIGCTSVVMQQYMQIDHPCGGGVFEKGVHESGVRLKAGEYVRVGVVGGGCSGFQYSFDFTNAYDEASDVISEFHGVGVVVDKKSDLFLDGTEIDFYSGLEKRGFTFKNPNAVKSCGCGSSFSA